MTYAELQVTTNFSFLRGASHPDEMVVAAAALGLHAVAVTDRNSLAGVVRAHVAAKQAGIRLLVGARLDFRDGHPPVLCLPTDRAAYGRLCRLLTDGLRRAPKGECWLDGPDLAAWGEGQVLIVLPEGEFEEPLAALAAAFPGAVHLAAHHHLDGEDEARIERLAAVAARCGAPLVATNDVHYHAPERRPLQDVLTAVRHHTTVEAAAGRLLFANAERHLKPAGAMAALFRHWPGAVARTVEIADRCRFSLDELRHEYAIDPAPAGHTPQSWLETLTWEGAARRYPDGLPDRVRRQVEHEFALIGQLGYAPYFLTVHDIVTFARSRGILCQGRGSAANSAVCYCLGITAVDPARADLLFERFVSAERGEPPDIDVDFEHERREEVIQYIYGKYGRHRAGLAATVITYRTRSAIRDVGKALGLSEDAVGALAKTVWGSSRESFRDAQVREAGLDPGDRRLRMVLDLADQLKGFPRHLSQHVGGFVMTRGRLDEVVPVANARMEDRTVIEWDKDDLDALGILKVDVLALGMLTCVRKAFDLLSAHHGIEVDLATVPAEDPAVYDMLCKGDSIGVFQVESRAQMAMLPRLQPRCFYDLVIEVAIVRPGPIQGDMVHPYLRRRAGKEKVTFPSRELEAVLRKTLGVPLFQEQAMRIAIEAAGFSPAEADRLRRAMATFKRAGQVAAFRDKFLAGMERNGYDPDFAASCFRQIEGFGEYGFPESHAASFALLVYVSAWLKCHYPAAFACALLNSQPMGFYAPAQIVRDARNHGVEVRPVDANASDWDCTLEPASGGRMALRLGLRQVTGLGEAEALRLVNRRGAGYRDPRDAWRRAELSAKALEALAKADAFAAMGLERRDALWAVKGLVDKPLPLFDGPGPEERIYLPKETEGERIVEDYSAIRLTLRRHPLALLRDGLRREGFEPASRLTDIRDGSRLKVAGLAVTRQRPGTASGVVFLTLEDETGVINVVVWPQVFEAHRAICLRGRLIGVEGRLQRDGMVVHLVADRLLDLSPRLAALLPDGGTLASTSRDFH
ncbi:MAG: error-prone DNA polymerase [Pseudomonadota bacterium]